MNTHNIVIMNRSVNISDTILPPPIIINKEIEEKLLHDTYSQNDDEDLCNYDCCDILLCACIFNICLK